MDTLTNYITERIRIDNVKHLEFPIDGTVDDMVEFLDEQGFKSLKSPKNGQIDTVFGVFNSRPTGKYYMLNTKPIPGLMFMNKKSKSNISQTQSLYEVVDTERGRLYLLNYSLLCYDEVGKNTFLQELNKQFGWQ